MKEVEVDSKKSTLEVTKRLYVTSNISQSNQIVLNTKDNNHPVIINGGNLICDVSNNVCFGKDSLRENTDYDSLTIFANGSNNVAFGNDALKVCTGSDNTAIGYGAGDSTVLAGKTVIIGSGAGSGVLTDDADGCVLIGNNAGTDLTEGDHAVLIGYHAGQSLTVTDGNTMIGYNAGVYTAGTGTNAQNNTFVGDEAGKFNTTGKNSTFIGALSGNGVTGTRTTGDSHTCLGYKSGNIIQGAANYNTYIGVKAGEVSTTASSNTCLGYLAGNSITTGNKNICIGRDSDVTATVSNQIAIGYQAAVTAQYGIAIGDQVSAAGNDCVIGKSGATITVDFDVDGTWSQTSDIRKKRNINDDTLGLSFINNLKTKTFQWRPAEEHPEEWGHFTINENGEKIYNEMNTETIMHGLIAQDVKEALEKENCNTFGGWNVDDKGQQQISKAMFVIPLIKAVQELSAQVEELKQKVAELSS